LRVVNLWSGAKVHKRSRFGVKTDEGRDRSEGCGDVETSGQVPGDWLRQMLKTLKNRETTGEDEPEAIPGKPEIGKTLGLRTFS
jgi:hypothetical protein